MNEEYVATNILPSLKFITDNEKNASVSMCVVGKKSGIWFICMYVCVVVVCNNNVVTWQ